MTGAGRTGSRGEKKNKSARKAGREEREKSARVEQQRQKRQRVERGGEKDKVFFFFFTLVTGPTRSLILKLSDSLKFDPASVPQHFSVKWLCLN